jgi:hypothetical protein
MSNLLSSSLPSTAANLGHVTLSVYSIKDWPQVEPLWVKLADSSPYSSFYVSAEWTGSWLEIFGELLQPQILVFEEQGVAVGACLLVKSTERRGPFRTRRIYLNTGGEDLARVKEFFDEMRQLHQSTWKARGEPGAFASGRRLAFHRTLICRAFPRGGIQMLRVTAGNETVGVLYNFAEGALDETTLITPLWLRNDSHGPQAEPIAIFAFGNQFSSLCSFGHTCAETMPFRRL